MSGTWTIEVNMITRVCPNCTYAGVADEMLIPDTFECSRCGCRFTMNTARITYWSEMSSGWIQIPAGCLLIIEEITA